LDLGRKCLRRRWRWRKGTSQIAAALTLPEVVPKKVKSRKGHKFKGMVIGGTSVHDHHHI
jgi:hypothetical protein